jgi:hypothetical protein
MKTSTLLASLLALGLTACGGGSKQAATETDAQVSEPVAQEAPLATPVAKDVAPPSVTESEAPKTTESESEAESGLEAVAGKEAQAPVSAYFPVAEVPVAAKSDNQEAAPQEAAAEPETQEAAPAVADTTQSTVGACYRLTTGNKYELSDGTTHTIVSNTFDGKKKLKGDATYKDDELVSTAYRTVTKEYVEFAGRVTPTEKVTYTGYKIPATMKPGDTSDVEYKSDTIVNRDGSEPKKPVTKTFNEKVTFVGVEDLTLGGKLFTGVCKIQIASPKGAYSFAWIAEGFGKIKLEKYDASGNELVKARSELSKLIKDNSPAK